MNYRHAYHAGNFADVHKHTLLLGLLKLLMSKDNALCFIDSHAGEGIYDLARAPAQKTLEFRQGIGLLPPASQMAHPWLKLYRSTVDKLRRDTSRPQCYPGSPALAASLLRPQDRGVLLELHPQDAAELRHFAKPHPKLAVHERDAYEGIPALIPPREKRGLVFIDPPYEQERDEWLQVVDLLHKGWSKWPTGVYALWYPIKNEAQTRRFQKRLIDSGLKKVLAAELSVSPADNDLGLNGSGMLIINAPWHFAEEAASAQEELWKLLSPKGQGKQEVRILAGER